MNLDVQIETAPDVAFETSVAQSIEADANLRLRGTRDQSGGAGPDQCHAGRAGFLRQQIHHQSGIDFVFQSGEDRSDSECRSGDEGAGRGCHADGHRADQQTERELPFGSAVAVGRYRGAAGDGPDADGSDAGGPEYGAVAEPAADGGVGADRPGDFESGRRATAAILRRQQDQDRSAAHGNHGQSRSASDDRTAGDRRICCSPISPMFRAPARS